MNDDNNDAPWKSTTSAGLGVPNDLLRQISMSQSAIQRITNAMQPLSRWQEQSRAATKILETHGSTMQNVAKMFKTLNNSPLAKMNLEAMGLAKPMLDMSRLNTAMGLSVSRRARLAALNTSLFTPTFTKEMQRFQATLTGFTQNSAVVELARHFDQFRAPHISALSEALRASALALRPYGDAFMRMAEEEKTAKFILELGFVPHDELWDHIADVKEEKNNTNEDIAVQIAISCWPLVYEKLVFDLSDCLNDQKLEALYRQMLASHDAGHHEIALSALPSALERAVRLATKPGKKHTIRTWLETDVAELPISVFGGIRGFRVWKILMEDTLASFKTEEDADAIKYPNRHVVAHGAGSQPAGVVQSLNAILLTHFVIRLARAVTDFRANDVA